MLTNIEYGVSKGEVYYMENSGGSMSNFKTGYMVLHITSVCLESGNILHK